MLALDEKVRTVVLLRPEVCTSPDGQAKDVEIIAKFEENYLEVKAKKQIYLTQADADQFFHYLPASQRAAQVEAHTRGLSTVLVVQHLEGEAIEKALALADELMETYGAGAIYCSPTKWETMRDLEFFFPHLDSLPTERTLAILKADGLAKGRVDGRTLEELVENEVAAMGLFIVAKKHMTLKRDQAEVVCEDLKDTPDFTGSIGILMAEPGVIVMLLEGRGAVGKWQLLTGPTNAGMARDRAPTTLRVSNAVHASTSLAAADKEIRACFPDGALQVQRTLCIVKPDALHGLLEIRMEVEAAGFTVLKDKQTTFTEERAKEFYRDSKEKPFFNALVKEACSGPCCVMVLCRLEAVTVWQQMMGPEVAKEARELRPHSVRARWGHDGQRNAVHGSDSAKSAAREVRFFFPELGADPIPDDDEVRDFLFRKSACASMDLKSLDADTADAQVDPTLQQLLSRGLMALCQVQPKGLAAVKWLSRWLVENNPNAVPSEERKKFAPPDRTKRFVEYGVNQDGMTFSVEAPPATKKKQVIEVDVSEETEENRVADLKPPPFVVFVAGGPGSGKGTQCSKLKEDFNFVHLSTGDLMREEVAAETYLGTEIYKHMQSGTLVPDTITLQLLKKTMIKHQDTNRFLLDGFPRSLEQAKRFEQEIGEVAFVLYFEASHETMKARIAERAVKAPGRVDDNPQTVEKRLKIFEEQTMPVIKYYGPIGKIRKANAEKDMDEVYMEAKRNFSCRFVYMLGPPGAPVAKVASCLEQQYSYSFIDFTSLIHGYANSDEPEARKVKEEVAKGKPVEASIACPLVLAEVYRGMALGVQNFVLGGFPQSLKQVEFLEYRVPCIARPLLLDFSRADADDLAGAAAAEGGGSLEEISMQMGAFFGGEMQEMLKKLAGLQRIPCSLAGLDGVRPAAAAESFEEQLVEATWKNVCEKVMPGVTLVLGLPCSGTGTLAPMLASLTPNTQAVDCSQLLDKEMERRTDIGVTMHNMLARGQVVPLSVTLKLLKGVINLTCSDSLVLENCPMYADQIEYLTKEFRIDRVFYIAGNDKAVQGWKEEFAKKASKGDNASKTFDERAERLEPIVQHFSRLGKLERLEVTKTPDAEKLRKLVEQATTPQFAIVTGLSTKLTPEQAAALAAAYGTTALTVEGVVQWANTTLKRTVDPAKPDEFFSALKKFADSGNSSLLVLDRYPCSAEDAAHFLGKFGEPKVVVNVSIDEEKMQEEFDEAHAEDDPPVDPDTVPDLLAAQRTAHDDMVKVFEEKSPSSLMVVDGKLPAPEITDMIKARLLPRAYVIVAPSGAGNFSGLLADGICTSRREGTKRRTFTAIDSNGLFERGCHSAAIEDKLLKASFMAEAPDALPAKLWTELYQEAFANSANPMGTFLITNFPTPCALSSSPTVRDQFHMLESISAFMGILHVACSEATFCDLCSDSAEDYQAYADFAEAVRAQTSQQFGSHQLCEVQLEDVKSAEEAVSKVTSAFLTFQDKVES